MPALAALSSPLPLQAGDFRARPGADRLGRIEFTRRPSAPDDRRVTMWRRRANGSAPPALLYDWMCEPGPLLVDGHDRLHAMALEGAPLRALKLTPTSFGGPDRKLVGGCSWGGTLATARYGVGRLYPLEGGLAAWRSEVRERSWAVRDDISPYTAQAMLKGV